MKYILSILLAVTIPNLSHATSGNCDGTQCGCHGSGSCWSYQYSNSKPGDPWCYTQVRGVKKGLAAWAGCTEHKNCSWEMNCGNNQLFFGNDPEDMIETADIHSDSAPRDEIDIAIIKLRAQNDLNSAKRKFDRALKELDEKYKQLLDQQTDQSESERKKLKAVIRDLCRMAGVKIPDAYRE